MQPTNESRGNRARVLAEAVARVEREFIEMPGLRLTHAQAARLCSLEPDTCDAAVQCLIEARFLARTSRSLVVRAAALAAGA